MKRGIRRLPHVWRATRLARRWYHARHGAYPDWPALIADAPELWHQRAYLARIFSTDPGGGLVDDGVQPLTFFLDDSGPDAIAVTLEADGSGAIYPVLYTRSGGEVQERNLEPDPLLRYAGPDARSAIAAIVREVVPGVPAGA